MDIVNTDVETKLGSPVSLENSSTSSSPALAAAPTTPTPSPAAAVPKSEPLFTTNSSSSNGFGRPSSSANMQMDASLTPIKNLNPYQNR